MEHLIWVWDYAVPFLLILTVLVFVHELGHYLSARRNGVRVEVFSIGFGPEIFGFDDKAGTRWKFSAVPLGGYIRMFGDEDASSRPSADVAEMSDEEKNVSFYHKSVVQRSEVVFAGPLANFVFAIVLLSGMFMTVGQPFSPAIVTGIQEDSPAAQAGLIEGDRVVSIGDKSIERFEDIQWVVRQSPEVPLDLIYLRDGAEYQIVITPQVQEGVDRMGNKYRIGLLGIKGSAREYVRHGPLDSIGRAVGETYSLSMATLNALGQMISGKRSTDELGGPLRIAQMSGEVSQYGLTTILWFMAVLSVNLGLINLFPVPLLDGGHLLYFAAEALRGKPLGERAQEYGFRLGLFLVLSLMLFATWNDLTQLGFFEFLQGLVG